MASEKPTRILLSKTTMKREDIAELSDKEAWDLIYSLPKQTGNSIPKQEEICFTGFDPDRKEELFEIAEMVGLKGVKSVTKKLAYLCCGENAGPSKKQKAEQQNSKILTEDDFINSVLDVMNSHLQELRESNPDQYEELKRLISSNR